MGTTSTVSTIAINMLYAILTTLLPLHLDASNFTGNHCFSDELKSYVREGILKELILCESQGNGEHPKYVQDSLKQRKEEVRFGGHFILQWIFVSSINAEHLRFVSSFQTAVRMSRLEYSFAVTLKACRRTSYSASMRLLRREWVSVKPCFIVASSVAKYYAVCAIRFMLIDELAWTTANSVCAVTPAAWRWAEAVWVAEAEMTQPPR